MIVDPSATLQKRSYQTIEQIARQMDISPRTFHQYAAVHRGSPVLLQALRLKVMKIGQAHELLRLRLPEDVYVLVRDEAMAAKAGGRRYTTKVAVARAKALAGVVPPADRLDRELVSRWMPRLLAVWMGGVRDPREDAAWMAALRTFARVAAAEPPPGLRPGDPDYPLDDDD